MVWVERLTRRHERHMREAFACSLERAVRDVVEPLRRGGVAIAIDRSAVADSPTPHRSEFPPGTLVRSAREILIAAEWRSPRWGPAELLRS